MNFKNITTNDIDLICDHRARMFGESGRSAESISAMTAPFKSWLQRHLNGSTYFGFTADVRGEIAGSVGLMLIDWPPHPEHPEEPRRGYILNLYVERRFRRQGLGRALMEKSEEEFTRRNTTYAILHPTDMAKPLYLDLGWKTSGELSKKIDRQGIEV
jgi:GNAT superfamily N-acetyltransferase